MDPHPYTSTSSLRYLSKLSLVFLTYVIAGKAGLAVPFTSGNVSPVWPPAGIALAALLIWGWRMWPAIALGAFVVNGTTPIPFMATVGIAIGNASSAVIAVLLLRRIPDFRLSLDRVRDAVALMVFGAITSTAVAATVGVTVLYLTGVDPWSIFASAWVVWWLGDALGILITTPLILTWRTLLQSRQDWLEKALLIFAAAAITLIVFDDTLVLRMKDGVLAFLVFPVIVWAAIRFGQAGTTVVSAVIAAIAVWKTALGHGPFVRHQPLQDAALLQLFFAVISATGLLLAAAVRERQQAEHALAREQQLLKDRDRAEQALIRTEKLAATGRLAATIAHEINNPLAAVTNLLHLARNTSLNVEATEFLRRVDEELRRVTLLTRKTLGFYRESSTSEIFPLVELIDEVLFLYESRLKDRGIQVTKRFDPAALVQGSRGELRQVVSNLIANAIDAVPTPGAIEIEVAEAQKVVLKVSDNGPGIDPGDLPRIFEPFFTTKREFGTGLGLWISKTIIEKHGGKITANNKDRSSMRTEFVVELPRAAGSSPQA